MDIKIESGIQIPTRGNPDGFAAKLRSMKVGDSFLFPKEKRNSLAARARGAGVKLVTRKDGEGTVRVWRTA